MQFTTFDEEMAAAVAKWMAKPPAERGEDMTGRELEAARAFYQLKKNSRQVRRINDVLGKRIAAVLRNE